MELIPHNGYVCYHDIDDGNIRVFYYDAPAETYVRNMINGFLILKLNKLVLIDTMEKAEKFAMLLWHLPAPTATNQH